MRTHVCACPPGAKYARDHFESWVYTTARRFTFIPGTNLSYVIKVPVRNFLLSRQLLQLVKKDVHLKLRAQVLKAAIAERLPAKIIANTDIFHLKDCGKNDKISKNSGIREALTPGH